MDRKMVNMVSKGTIQWLITSTPSADMARWSGLTKAPSKATGSMGKLAVSVCSEHQAMAKKSMKDSGSRINRPICAYSDKMLASISRTTWMLSRLSPR